jgi:hypothetical protein
MPCTGPAAGWKQASPRAPFPSPSTQLEGSRTSISPCQIRVRSHRRSLANADPTLPVGRRVSLLQTLRNRRRPSSDRNVTPEVAGSSPVAPVELPTE